MRRKVSPKSKGKVRGGPQTKEEQVPTFFDFFSPPAVPTTAAAGFDAEDLQGLQQALEEDYELGCAHLSAPESLPACWSTPLRRLQTAFKVHAEIHIRFLWP